MQLRFKRPYKHPRSGFLEHPIGHVDVWSIVWAGYFLHRINVQFPILCHLNSPPKFVFSMLAGHLPVTGRAEILPCQCLDKSEYSLVTIQPITVINVTQSVSDKFR